MAQDNVTRCVGLVSQYNPLSLAPGALLQADDAVVRRENVIENRRGYNNYGTLSNVPTQLFIYNNKVLALNSTTMSYDNGSGTFANYSGSYSPPTAVNMRACQAVSNLYATTSLGVKVFTDTSGTAARLSGAPRSLDPSYALNAAGAGFLAASYQCAYRCVIQRTDANGNVLFGYPSTRLVAYNTAGTSKNIDLTLYLPDEVTTADVIQFYRTTQVSGTASDTSGDEMYLVYQINPTSTDVTNGYLTFTDSITDALQGATLYTSPSQEGISQANDRPPLSKDLALYKSSYMFYGNTSTKQRLFFTLVGTSGLNGNYITLGGLNYTFNSAAASENPATRTVQVGSAAGPSGVAAVDIDDTARSLVRVINRASSNTTVYAYYLSGSDELPGQIMIEEVGIGAAAFTILSQNTTIKPMFFPAPPVGTPNSQSTSSNSVQKNALFYSKGDQPEAVPALNYFFAGPSNSAILRIAPLRDSLIIISESGVYRLTGDTPQSFNIVPLDLTTICKCPDSVVILSNTVFMLSNQGVVAITDSGVQVVSREIEPDIIPLLTYSNLAANTFAVSYESDRAYILSTVENSNDSAPVQCFVYNLFTRAWTKYTYGFTNAIIEPSVDKMFLTKASESTVYRERKTFADDDYADPDYAITITSLSTTTVTFTTGGVTPLPGWKVFQGATGIAIDSVTDNGGASFTCVLSVDTPSTWTVAAATLTPSVPMVVRWADWTGQQPGLLKAVRYASILADNTATNHSATKITATFQTDLDSQSDEVDIESSVARWGLDPWGSSVWGGQTDTYGFPTYIPQRKHYCRVMTLGFRHSIATEKVSITGFSLTFDQVSERINR